MEMALDGIGLKEQRQRGKDDQDQAAQGLPGKAILKNGVLMHFRRVA
jgi:hypothetical protein